MPRRPEDLPRLHVDADLRFEVDGGAVAGTVTGSGDRLVIETSDAEKTWDAALGSPATGSSLLDPFARLLHDSGLTLEVTGPDGTVATVGAGVDSRLGRLTTGSRHVRLGEARAVAPLARSRVRDAGRDNAPALGVVGAGAVLVGLLLWLRRRR